MPSRPDATAKLHIDARRSEAAHLKARGWSLEAVGKWLHADPAVSTRVAAGKDVTPEGYGIDLYKSGGEPLAGRRLIELVSRDLRRGFEARMSKFEENVDALRVMRVMQYEALLRPALEEVDDLGLEPAERAKAADRALRILTRLDTVQGVARPVRTELTGAAGGPVQVERVDVAELEALIAATCRLDSEQAANTATRTTGMGDGDA